MKTAFDIGRTPCCTAAEPCIHQGSSHPRGVAGRTFIGLAADKPLEISGNTTFGIAAALLDGVGLPELPESAQQKQQRGPPMRLVSIGPHHHLFTGIAGGERLLEWPHHH